MAGHAKLSPSSAERWMTCPGSVALSEGYADRSSAVADEGTAAHELAERIPWVDGLVHHGAPAREQSRADLDQEFDQQRFLVGEVPVDRGAADVGGGADVLEPDREVTPFGELSLRGGQQLRSPVRLELGAPAGCRALRRW